MEHTYTNHVIYTLYMKYPDQYSYIKLEILVIAFKIGKNAMLKLLALNA